jgi:hypothetical protein
MRIETHPCVAANVGYFAQKITPKGMALVGSDPSLPIASILKHSWQPNAWSIFRGWIDQPDGGKQYSTNKKHHQSRD